VEEHHAALLALGMEHVGVAVGAELELVDGALEAGEDRVRSKPTNSTPTTLPSRSRAGTYLVM
jgi:hypothetical protein